MYCVTAHVKIRGKSSKEKNEVYKKNKTLKKPKFPIQRREELMKLNILRGSVSKARPAGRAGDGRGHPGSLALRHHSI